MGKALNQYDGYEEPEETDDYKFSHWEDKDGNKYYGTTVLIGSIELSAKYQNKPKEEEVKVDTYTIQIINDDSKGKLNGPGSFTIRLGDKILASMSEAGIKNPTANKGYTFVGWSFDGQNLISSKDLYTDKTKTEIKAVYIEFTITIQLSSAEGIFKNGERVKNLVSTKSMALEEYKGYEEPTREGYNFKDWQNGATIIISKDEIKVDTSLVARYKSIGGTEEPEKPAEDTTYTINIINNSDYGTYTGPNSFDISLGAIVRSIMNNYNIKDPKPNDDKVFLGWSWDGSKDNILGSSETYTNSNNRSLEAVYADKTYKVILSAGDGEFADGTKSKEITSSEKVALNAFTNYEEPTKEGYVFKRWMSGGVEVASTSIITKDMTIFAHFAKVSEEGGTEETPETTTTYTISVSNDDSKGTYNGSASFEIALGSVILSSMSEAGVVDPEAKDSYKFLGWSWDGNKDNLIKDTDKYVDTTLKTVSAVYDEKTYTVVLSAGDGEFTGGLKSKEITSKEKVALNAFTNYEEPTKAGYVFRRWTKGGVEVASTSVIESDMTLIANFARVIPEGEVVEDKTKYTIAIENDDVAGKYTGPTSFELAIGNIILASMSEAGVVDPTANENYNFLGWSWNGDKENLVKATDRYLDVTLATISSVYSQDTYTVTLNGGEGVFADGKKTKEIKSHSKISLGEFIGYEEPVRDDYKFVRWLNKDGVEVATTSVITSDVLLYASYIKNAEDITDTRYTVTISNDSEKGVIKVGGIEKETASFKIDLGVEVLVALASASITAEAKEGYVFKGWSWSGDIATLIQVGDKYNDNRNTSLKAVYTKETEKTVVLKANTGVFMSTGARTLTLVSESAAKTLESFDKYEEPVKEDATFDRWVKEDGAEFAKSNVVTADLVLTAVYKDKDGNDIGVDDETKDGGEDATYTVVIKSEAAKGTLSNATKKTINGVEYYVAVIDVKTGDKILDKLEEKGLTVEADEERWIYEGWSKTNDKNGLLDSEDVFDDKSVTTINAIFYATIHITVSLNANTGIFKETGERIKVVTSYRKVELGDFKGYEEPVKSEGYKFVRWEDKDENKYELTHEFGEELNCKTIELFAIYTDENGNIVGRGETKDGGSKSTYTVYTKYDENKATHKKSSFEVAKDGLVIKAMKDYDAYEAVEVEGWWEQGWSWSSKEYTNLIDEKTIYNDITKTYIYAQYRGTNMWTIVLNANTGLFSDNTRQKKLENTKKVEIENFEGYEVPTKSQGFTFDRWEDKDGNVYKATDFPPDPFNLVLYAIYKDKNGKDVGKDDKKEGGKNATYTIKLSSDDEKGDIGDVKTFEIAIGDNILATMSNAGVKEPTGKGDNYFIGWSWDEESYDKVITSESVYKGNESEKKVLYALYSNELFEVTIKANTGIFSSDNSREKVLQVPKFQLLKANSGYEVPVKANATFNRWLKNDAIIGEIDTYKIMESQTLEATYRANDGSNDIIGKDSDTKEGGENATYTIRIVNDNNFGDYRGSEYFEIKKGEVIFTTMQEAGVTEGLGKPGYTFRGWRLGSEYISATTIYEDTENTTLYLDYSNQTFELTLDASVGRFKDKSKIKEINVAKGRVINTIKDYEEPVKEGWTFNRWLNGEAEVASTSTLPYDISAMTLKARYLNKEGKEANEDSHKHLECGATDETASHAFDVISNHDREIAYLPVSNKEEFMDYIRDEMAKDETDRSDIRLYLEENIELDDEILLDGATNLYICLNGNTLTSREFGNRNNESGNIFLTNCKEDEAAIVQTATDSNLAKTFFGTNDLHILSAKGKINVKPLNRLVEVSGGAGLFPRVIELMNAKVSGNKEIAIDRLIKAEGYSSIRLVDVDISDVNLTDTLIASYEGSELVFGGQVNLTNNFTQRALVETRDVFSLMDNATLNISDNTILKNENGNVAIIFIGGANNYLGGYLLVKNNKLELSDEYKKLVNAKPVTDETTDEGKSDEAGDDTTDDDLTNDDDLYGAYDEEVSPAGEVGYASAVAFTKENISLDVGNAKIEIYGNESVASDSNVRAEYMYQLRALSNTSNPLIRQKSGTALSDDSVIGIAFATEDGEGVLTNSAKIGKEVFVNKTFGKEEKLLNIKDNAGNLELARKTYSVVYDEGEPTTNETKMVIDALFPDGSTISEATRVRSKEIKAGHNVKLFGDDIYRAKGFDLATYSLVNKNNVELGKFIPSATVSYVESLFGDGVDIEDGDEIKAVSNYKEKELKSEAKEPIVITKEDYDKVVNEVVNEAVTSAASKSVADQAVADSEENYYTVRYHLEGGHIDGAKDNGLDYFDDERISRKADYTLISNISKVATESGVRKEYDFISWHEKNDEGEIDDSPVAQISANTFDGELLEVYAEYLPSTYKITYHLDGGKLAGYEEDDDTVEDTINRNQDYILLRGVTKDDFAFTGWRVDMDGYITNATELSKGTVNSDVEAYAEYRTALYEVTYNLNGGSIRNLTDEESDTYVDSKANMLYDYYLPQDVTKRGYKFTGWETANGVKVDVIPAGDNDESKRSVVATFAPTTWRIIYDTDGGTIAGYPEGNITDNVTEDMEYVLYTDVVKEGYKFEYWYDVSQPTRKIDVIKSAAGGSEFRVKAKYSPLTYSLKLHIDEDSFVVNINGISSDEAYILPTDITVDNKEFVNWNYVDAKGAPVFIEEIEAGNPKKITDVYANYEDLMTWKIVYHLGPNEFIKDETDYDATSTAEEKTKTIVVNRRKNTALYDNVIKTDVAMFDNTTTEVDVFGSGEMGAAKKYEFYGWTIEKAEPDSLGDKAYESIYKLVSAVSKETEESEIKSGKAYSKVKEWHYYPYFETAHPDTVEVEYHFADGGSLPGMKVVDGKYTETVPVISLLSLSHYYMLSAYSMVDGYTFGGIYRNGDYTGEQVRTIGPEELKQIAEDSGKLNLYVKLTKTKFKLTYHLNGGNIKGRTVAADETKFETSFDNSYVTYLLASVERKGYAFTGWRASNEEDAEVVKQIDRGVEKDVELYASWKRDSYTVNYMLNGGRVSGKANKDFSETYSNSKTNELISNVTKSGANFLGWYTEKNGKGEKIEKIEASETPLEDLTVYAFYESTLYSVNYYANGGKIRGVNADPYVRVYDGKDHITLLGGEDVIKEGGQFLKWVDEDGTEFKDIGAGHKGNLNLYAIYLFGSVDITFDIGNRGTLKGSKAKNGKVTRTYGKGDDIVLPTMGDFNWPETRKNSKSGETFEEYYFAGWYKDKNYKGKKIEVIPAGNPDNITELYAKWEFAPYIITYHLNGGTIAGLSRFNEIDESIDIMSKVKAYELPKDVTRADAKFLGWYEDKNLKVGPVTKLSANPKQMKDGTVHLYAKWEKEVIYVYYNCYLKNDFRPKSDRVKFDVNNTVTYLLEDEKGSLLKGYVSSDVEFDGWFLEKDANNQGTGQEVYSIGKDVKDDVELYARFVRISDMSINEYYRFTYRKMDRESKLKQEKWKRDRELVELANDIQRQILADLTGGNTGAIEHIIKNYYGSITSTESKEETQIEEVDETKTKNKAFGGLFDPLRKLFGDDDSEEPKAGDPEDEEEIVVNISDLLAYDTVSAERLGLETPQGTKLDCIFITSITDSEGNSVADTRFVGQMLKAGSNFSDLAEAYPGHLFGMRPVFVDEKVYEKPKQPNDDYYYEGGGRGGRGGSGGGGGGRGNTAGKKPATYDAITVNPYGFDGRGSDNGAARANILKADINNRLGRTATLSAIEYKTIDVLDKDNVFAGLTAETWEYFPASNNFKLFLNAPNHERYYITNGWYACTFNEQKIWYKFNKDGIMQRGFVEDGGKVYYLNNSLNELGYMVTGYKDFEGTGYTGYFGADGALVSIFPTTDRASYEGGLSALPKEANFDRAKYELCKKTDKESTRIVSTDKAVGQCAVGNFVGYWYNLASGQRKFRFETINNNLQVVKFATDGWMNIYDANNTLYSYRFDNNANVVLNTITPDGLIVGSDGHLIGTNILLDFNIAGILQYNTFALATTTLNTLPVTAEGLKSLLVGTDGVPLEISPATDIWTNINFEGPEPLLSNKVYGAISLVKPELDIPVEPLQLLSNAVNTVSNVMTINQIDLEQLGQIDEVIPIIDPVGIAKPLNIVKMTKVLVNWILKRA
ncbi:MAG: InlB B-repeat-containing protein [Lachnospiraceae bacterium]|nr:InlB B-repeat-containing protein [Lachnospiraceae bacterium]